MFTAGIGMSVSRDTHLQLRFGPDAGLRAVVGLNGPIWEVGGFARLRVGPRSADWRLGGEYGLASEWPHVGIVAVEAGIAGSSGRVVPMVGLAGHAGFWFFVTPYADVRAEVIGPQVALDVSSGLQIPNLGGSPGRPLRVGGVAVLPAALADAAADPVQVEAARA